MKTRISAIVVTFATLLVPGVRGFGATISDELLYSLRPGASTIPLFNNLHPVLFENNPAVREAQFPSKLLVDWDPTNGLVTPKTIVLTQPGGGVSDILKLTVNVDSSVLTFEFISDRETRLVDPSPTTSIKIPEAGDANHKLNGNGFLDLTRDLFPEFEAGKEPVSLLAKSAVEEAKSQGKSVHFDASTSSLSFAGDVIFDTLFPGDPLVGAAVDLPTFLLDGSTLGNNLVIFRRSSSGGVVVHKGSESYLKANISLLSYDRSANVFAGMLSGLSVAGADPTSPLFDPSLASINSPFLLALDSLFNPASLQFEPQAGLFISYQPDRDFFASTTGFTMSAESPITNFIYPGDVPESSSGCLLGCGFTVLSVIFAVQKRRRMVQAETSHGVAGWWPG